MIQSVPATFCKNASQSPELNPIEHLWDATENKLADCRLSSVDEPKFLLVETWRKHPLNLLPKLVDSMNEKMQIHLFSQ